MQLSALLEARLAAITRNIHRAHVMSDAARLLLTSEVNRRAVMTTEDGHAQGWPPDYLAAAQAVLCELDEALLEIVGGTSDLAHADKGDAAPALALCASQALDELDQGRGELWSALHDLRDAEDGLVASSEHVLADLLERLGSR